jgi:hypothetical protein
VDRNSKASTFWACFIHAFSMALIFFVYPVYAVLCLLCGAYATAAALIAAGIAMAATAAISAYAASNYYFSSLIVLCDDSGSAARQIYGCLESMGYFGVKGESAARVFRSKKFYFVRREVSVEINAGCAVLRGPKCSINRVAAIFDNCYDWSDKH